MWPNLQLASGESLISVMCWGLLSLLGSDKNVEGLSIPEQKVRPGPCFSAVTTLLILTTVLPPSRALFLVGPTDALDGLRDAVLPKEGRLHHGCSH